MHIAYKHISFKFLSLFQNVEMAKGKKRGGCQGFDGVKGEQTAKRIKLWGKNNVELSWRNVRIEKLRYTLVHRTLKYGENKFVQTFIPAFGTREAVKKRKSDARIAYTKKSLPDGAVEALVLPENYDHNDITIEMTDDGDLGFKELYVVICKKCHMSDTCFMRSFCLKYKSFLPENPKLADLMENWDRIIEKHPEEMKHLDVLGCILPHETHIFASPNERKFITRPAEHAASKCHQWTSVAPATIQPLTINIDDHDALPQPSSSSSTSSITSSLTSPASKSPLTSPKPAHTKSTCSSFGSPTSVKKQSLLTVGLDGNVTAERSLKVSNTKTDTTTTITLKNNKKIHFKPINQIFDPAIGVFQEPTSGDEKMAQNACYSFVLSGCSKEVSNNTTIEFYDKHIDHLRLHHQEHLGHLEIDNKVPPKPIRAQLDRNNIKYVHAALVESYKNLTSSSVNKLLYKPFVGNCHYSVFCDGIQKFGRELNGSFARTADSELEVTNAPISLHSIQGGSMDRYKLAVDLMNIIHEIKPVSGVSAYSFFIKDTALGDRPEGVISPPQFFKCCKVINVDYNLKKLELLFENWPVCIAADSCSTNAADVELLVNKVGLLSPKTRCSAHAAHGSVRRLATSKTMSVQEVVEYATNLRPVLKHFKNSGKSLSSLNDALKILEMKKRKALTWCPTRMGYLLTSSKESTELLVPISDVLSSCDIPKELASYFLSPKCIATMHILGDVEGVLMDKFIRRLDGDNSIIIDVFQESENTIQNLDSIEMQLFDSYLEGLEEDDYGNVTLNTVSKSENGEIQTHKLSLNYTHHPGRRVGVETKIEKLKREATLLKDSIILNLKENIQDQNQAGTLVEFASCFDMNRDLSRDDRVALLKELHNIFCSAYVHDIEDQGDYGVSGWDVTVKYEAKIEISEDDICAQFRALWPKMNKEWVAMKKEHKHVNTKAYWKHMLEQYAYMAPELFELVNIMVSISPGTGPLERSYSKLEKICKKDRNNLSSMSMQNLWLLAIYQLKDCENLFDGVRMQGAAIMKCAK